MRSVLHGSVTCLLTAAVAVVTGCGEPGPGNRVPVARAPADAAISLGDTVSLDGSGSHDPDGDALVYTWQVLHVPAGSAWIPSDAAQWTGAQVEVTPDAPGSYVLALQVADPSDLQSRDVVNIHVEQPLAVIDRLPLDGAAAGDLHPMVVFFAEPIRPWTVDAGFHVDNVTDPTDPIPIEGRRFTDDGDTALVFEPVAPWEDGNVYRVTVERTVRSLIGRRLAQPLVYEFTASAAGTDLTGPQVVRMTPANGAGDVALGLALQVTFSEPIDAATLPGGPELTDSGAATVATLTELAAGGTRATVVVGNPTPQALAPGEAYTFTVRDTITDVAGNPLDGDADGAPGGNAVSGFTTTTTVDQTPPVVTYVRPFSGASDILVKTDVLIRFSEPVLPSSVTTNRFRVEGPSGPVAATIRLESGNTVAILEPDANLLPVESYTTIVSGAIEDLSANVLDGDGDGIPGGNLATAFLTGSRLPPTVQATAPSSSPVSSTLTVDVIGEDFRDGGEVIIEGGGVLVTDTTFISDALLQATLTIAPSADLGARTVTVINPDGESGRAPGTFAVLAPPPDLFSVSPGMVSRNDAAAPLTLLGSGFDPAATVSVAGSGVTVDTVNFVSTAELQVTVSVNGTAPLGLRDVVVTNPDLQTGTATAALDVRGAAPVITMIDTPQGRRQETLTVVITGTDFVDPPLVSFGAGVGVTSVTFDSPTQLTVDVAVAANAVAGLRNVQVTNPDSQSDSLPNSFTVLRAIPGVTSAAPASGSQQAIALGVLLGGDHFDCSAAPGTVPAVDFNDPAITVTGVDCGGSTSEFETALTATVDIGAGAVLGAHNVDVTNPGDTGSGIGTGLFTVREEPPTLLSVTPNPEQGETRNVTVAGDFFQPTPTLAGPPGVTFNTITHISPTELTVNLTVDYSVSTGTYNLTVTNPDNQQATASVLTVVSAPAPTVSQVVPSTVETGTATDLTVLGTGFQPGAGPTTVEFSAVGGGFPDADVSVGMVTVNSPTSLTVSVTIGGGADTSGFRDVRVTNPVGAAPQGTGIGLFHVTGPPPAVTSIVPASANQGDNLTGVQVNGSDFRAGASVDFGAGIIVSNVAVAAAQITCDLAVNAGAAVGFRDVAVTNADTTSATLAGGFEVKSASGGPGVNSVSPDNLRQGETTTVSVLGSSFQSGATVQFSGPGLVLSNTTFIDASQIDVDVTVNCGSVPPGLRDVTVINPDAKSGTRVEAFLVRNGVVINEVVTSPRTNRDGDLLNNPDEMIELYNGSPTCTFGIDAWRLDFVDADGITGYQIGSATSRETLSAGHTRSSFGPGGFIAVESPDGNGANLQNDVFIALYDDVGHFIDDIEVGDDEENDGNDGGPEIGNDGGSSSTANESVIRCPDGGDTDHDVNDLYQDELGGFQAASTDAASNNGECPPCADGVDNDTDTFVDLDDPDCGGDPLGSES